MHDPHAPERGWLTSTVESFDDEPHRVRTLRNEVARELGDVPEVRAERDGLEGAISQSMREQTAIRDELVERELRAPGAWVRDTFGERPEGPWAGEAWESGVRRVARYRAEYGITDPWDAIGPRPQRGEQRRLEPRSQGDRAGPATARP